MTITIDYEAEKKLPIPWEKIIREIIEESLSYEECPYEAEVNVLLTDNREIQEMNREYRQIDRPTDVLSFPMIEYDTPSDFSRVEEEFCDCFNPESGELMLGDIILSVDKVEEQALAYGHSTERELAFLVAHSMLHLCGYDHMEEEERLIMEKKQEEIGKRIQNLYWDNDRFIRGYTQAGERIGAASDKEANLWLNPQSWAVISGLASKEQAESALEAVYQHLNTEYGAILMNPPYHSHAFDGALAVIYNQGTKENAGIFSQSQGWLILAEALCGHGEHAFTYFMENAPSAQNDRAEVRRLEPYCYGQFTEGIASRHPGRSHVHWLTGTASTMMVGCVEGILGIRPDLTGIRLSPSIPKSWDSLEIHKDFRGKQLHIVIQNPDQKETGVRKTILNGTELDENYIPESLLHEKNEILLIM